MPQPRVNSLSDPPSLYLLFPSAPPSSPTELLTSFPVTCEILVHLSVLHFIYHWLIYWWFLSWYSWPCWLFLHCLGCQIQLSFLSVYLILAAFDTGEHFLLEITLSCISSYSAGYFFSAFFPGSSCSYNFWALESPWFRPWTFSLLYLFSFSEWYNPIPMF